MRGLSGLLAVMAVFLCHAARLPDYKCSVYCGPCGVHKWRVYSYNGTDFFKFDQRNHSITKCKNPTYWHTLRLCPLADYPNNTNRDDAYSQPKRLKLEVMQKCVNDVEPELRKKVKWLDFSNIVTHKERGQNGPVETIDDDAFLHVNTNFPSLESLRFYNQQVVQLKERQFEGTTNLSSCLQLKPHLTNANVHS